MFASSVPRIEKAKKEVRLIMEMNHSIFLCGGFNVNQSMTENQTGERIRPFVLSILVGRVGEQTCFLIFFIRVGRLLFYGDKKR